MRLRQRISVLIAVALGGVLIPALGASPSSAAVPPAPAVGSCYNYTYDQSASAFSPTGKVDCATTHTAITYFVGTLKGAAATATWPTADAVTKQAGATCQGIAAARYGARLWKTRAGVVFYVPTSAQWKAGARWYRCDLALYYRSNVFSPIPVGYETRLKTAEGINRYARCLASDSVTSVVVCSKPHKYKVAAGVSLGAASDAYPGDAVVAKRAAYLCAKAVGAPLYFWVYPLRDAWFIGTRHARCYIQDTATV